MCKTMSIIECETLKANVQNNVHFECAKLCSFSECSKLNPLLKVQSYEAILSFSECQSECAKFHPFTGVSIFYVYECESQCECQKSFTKASRIYNFHVEYCCCNRHTQV